MEIAEPAGVASRPLLRALSPFNAFFDKATNLALHRLFALNADWLAEYADDLADVASEYESVLTTIAGIIGLDLDGLSPGQEARAQREIWMAPSTWAVQTLIGGLLRSSEPLDEGGWAERALDHETTRPAPSRIRAGQELDALVLSARNLIASVDLRDGRALFLNRTPLLVSSDGRVVETHEVQPVLLIHRNDEQADDPPPTLSAGDTIWLAESAEEPPFAGPVRKLEEGRFEVSGDGFIDLAGGERLVAISRGVWGYFSGR